MKKLDLAVLILTFDLDQEVRPARFLPKVCHKVMDKTMIEIAIETCLKLNPTKIILYVSKNNIECINKTLKHNNYSKLITYYILSDDVINRRLKTKCLQNKNILVIPGNSPLLTSKTLYRVISDNRNIKIHNSLFYLKKECIDKVDLIQSMSITKDFYIPEMELKRVETKSDLDTVIKYLEDKK